MMGFKHLGIKQSDFAEFSPVNAKRHLERCLFKNGALSKAIIGLRMRKNAEYWKIDLKVITTTFNKFPLDSERFFI